ncbi:peptidase M14, partial [Candidatus Woesearchaeota archaeon]|nr:peptidase M14 [Candidatus Woesearchaeota archaeon]
MKEVHDVVRFDFRDAPKGKITRYQFEIAADGLGYPIKIPLIVAHGNKKGPILGVTAVIHGNEINGLPVIQRVMKEINIETLRGIVVGIPVLNIPGFLRETREFNNGIDLNQKIPGKENGNRSDVYAYRFFKRIISQFTHL